MSVHYNILNSVGTHCQYNDGVYVCLCVCFVKQAAEEYEVWASTLTVPSEEEF